MDRDRERAFQLVRQGLPISHQDFDYYQNDKEFVIEAIRNNPHNFNHCLKKWRLDEEVALEAIRKDASCFFSVGCHLTDDVEFVLKAVEVNEDTLIYVDDEYKTKWFVLEHAYRHQPNSIKHFPPSLLEEIGDSDVIEYLTCVKEVNEILRAVGLDFLTDYETPSLAIVEPNNQVESEEIANQPFVMQEDFEMKG